jgi:hypothetical protein
MAQSTAVQKICLVAIVSVLASAASLPPLSTPEIGHKLHYGMISNQVLYPAGSLSADLANFDQGDQGDCYFLSSEMALAQRFPAVIQARIQANDDGTYSGNFFGTLRGEKGVFAARVNGDLPEDSKNRTVKNSVEVIAGKSVSWVAISEKLWAAVNGNSYRKIEGTDDPANDADIERALYALTGKPVIARSLSTLTFLEMQSDYAAGPVVIGTGRNGKLLDGNHALAVLAVNANQTVELGDPEGGSVKMSFSQLTHSNVNQYLMVVLNGENGQ